MIRDCVISIVTLQYLLTREILLAEMRNATDLQLTILMLIPDVWLALAMILTGGFRAEESDAKGQVEQELKTFTFIDTSNFHQYDQLSSIKPTFINATNFHQYHQHHIVIAIRQLINSKNVI